MAFRRLASSPFFDIALEAVYPSVWPQPKEKPYEGLNRAMTPLIGRTYISPEIGTVEHHIIEIVTVGEGRRAL